MEVRGGALRLNQAPERHSCRPSVDVLFESLAAEYKSSVATCLLTGMGRDGAAGTLAVHRAGGLTFAQDEASSVVYGMPREAVMLNAVDHVLPLNEIAPTLTRMVAMRDGGRSS
jgi:two-component system chemotaxis response regulator CheB